MTTLNLTLKKKWFDMIKSGEKTEEYREIKPYWLVRFISWAGMSKLSKIGMCQSLKDRPSAAFWNFNNNYCNNVSYDTIRFTNGYSKNAPTFDIECKGISIGIGKSEWGAPAENVFIISLGSIK